MSLEADMLKNICAGIEHHNATCAMPARAVLLNPGNHELFGWTELMGLAVEAHPDVPPRRFRIDCSGSAFGIEEQLEQVMIAPVETEPVVMPVPGPGMPGDL